MSAKPAGRIKRTQDDNRSKLPIIGKIKIGLKNERGLPYSIDYFHPDCGENKNYQNMFWEKFGRKPNCITIVFPSNDVRQVCNERHECRDGQGRLVAYGDGVNSWMYNPKTKQYESVDRDKLPKSGWKVLLTLRFMIPKFSGVFGLWQLDTHGKESSIPGVISAFDSVAEIAGPSIIRVPFDLSVKFAKSQKPGENSRFPVISLVPNLSRENLEKVKELHNAGASLNGLLTVDKLEKLSQDQIGG